jgi:hypothetical protein
MAEVPSSAFEKPADRVPRGLARPVALMICHRPFGGY